MNKWYWDIDPASGDYALSGGSPVLTNSLTIPSYIRLKAPRTQWMYAPDVNYGSDFYKTKRAGTTQQPNVIEDIAATALTPIVEDGRALRIDVLAENKSRNSVALAVQVTDAQGDIEQLNLTGLL